MQLSLEELHATPIPDTLYHYTSAAGLHGIITSRTVFATVIHFLNDSQEFQHAIATARSLLQAREGKAQADDELKVCKWLSTSLDQIKEVNICAFSLSTQGDLLSQWRAYCPPGGGYSLGFNTQLLIPFLKKENFWLLPCVYETVKQRELMEPIIEKAIETFLQLENRSQERFAKDVAPRFFFEFTRIAPILKHPAFREEQEWRAVSPLIRSDRLQLRPTTSLLVPYLAVQLGENDDEFPLHHVVVGPHAHQRLALSGVAFLLKKGHVTVSFTPYRQL